MPLSDERLKPRHTQKLLAFGAALALAAVYAVYILVPRGVSIGEVTVQSSKMVFNGADRLSQSLSSLCITSLKSFEC